MGAYVDKRGPYLIELASNADARRVGGAIPNWPWYYAENLFISRDEKCCWAKEGSHIIYYFGHEGAGKPKRKGQQKP